MKTLFVLLFALTGFIANANAQTVVVQNNKTASEQVQDPNIFYINGIPSTQDIGGVENEAVDLFFRDGSGYHVYFTNYNSSTVTVLYQITFGDKELTRIGSVVLKAKEKKDVLLRTNCSPAEIATITRRLQ